MEAYKPKQQLIEKLKEFHQVEPIRGADVIALNSKAIIYIRYNKKSNKTPKDSLGKFWFGITASEYEKYSDRNFFIICACVFKPEEVDYIVIPADEFDKIKTNIDLQSGQWKFNLLKDLENRYSLDIPKKGKYDISQFLNYFDFSPSKFRKIFTPQIGPFHARPSADKPILTTKNIPIELQEELLITSKDSSNPKNFEFALEKFFNELGFKCKRIGGPGETDVLVTEPLRFIVEGKSTKADSKSTINFTRIKRHMDQNHAHFMVIASVGFDPAVARDAELEKATLIEVQMLADLLRVHKDYMLSPIDYLELFKKPGLVTKERFEEIQRKIELKKDIIMKSLAIMENLDFSYRSLDEMKGRMDLYCDQRVMEKIEKDEIKRLLEMLAHPIFGIVAVKESEFASRFTAFNNLEKVKNTLILLVKQTNFTKDGRSS